AQLFEIRDASASGIGFWCHRRPAHNHGESCLNFWSQPTFGSSGQSCKDQTAPSQPGDFKIAKIGDFAFASVWQHKRPDGCAQCAHYAPVIFGDEAGRISLRAKKQGIVRAMRNAKESASA